MEKDYLAEAARIRLTRNLGNSLLEQASSEKKYSGSYAVALKSSHVLQPAITARIVKKELRFCADIFFLTPGSSITI